MKSAAFTLLDLNPIVNRQVKKNKSIVYGARSINKQINWFKRETFDWDIMAKKPKKSALELERTLDKRSRGDLFYYTPSKITKGVHKVYWKGIDRRKGTKDDVGVADFTPLKKIKTVRIGGVRYSHLSEEIKNKKKALASKKYYFRHAKDRDDLNRIKAHRKFRR